MLHNIRFRLASIIAVVAFTTIGAVAYAIGNTFIVGDLRVDLFEVYDAKDNPVYLLAHDKPSTGDIRNFATA